MLQDVCVRCLIEKTRYCVPYAGLSGEVDVFRGALAGITPAEVEPTHEAQTFIKPDWIEEEVTADLRFRQSTLVHLCS
ncbi:Inorganic triphosphatase [Methylobacterium mesophilicum]|nr:Inorganic triphosphatase [Methylobacterium mesophilicum]